jgi:hypothetical protein
MKRDGLCVTYVPPIAVPIKSKAATDPLNCRGRTTLSAGWYNFTRWHVALGARCKNILVRGIMTQPPSTNFFSSCVHAIHGPTLVPIIVVFHATRHIAHKVITWRQIWIHDSEQTHCVDISVCCVLRFIVLGHNTRWIGSWNGRCGT